MRSTRWKSENYKTRIVFENSKNFVKLVSAKGKNADKYK